MMPLSSHARGGTCPFPQAATTAYSTFRSGTLQGKDKAIGLVATVSGRGHGIKAAVLALTY
jgi:hypothetical protein